MRKLILALAISLMCVANAQTKDSITANKLYLKANALFLPIGIVNAGAEYQLNQKITLQGDVFVSPWKSFAGKPAQVYMVGFDGRYYFDEAFKYFDSIGFYFEPGCFSNIFDINSESKLLEALYSDLNILGIKYSDKIDSDYLYKVAVFQEILPEPDFHFSRLNGNGLWSCKNGIGGEIEKGNKPVAGFAYKLIKVLDINK